MKIAFIVSCFPKISESFIVNEIIGLIDLGHEVEIFAYEKGAEDKINENILKYGLLGKVRCLKTLTGYNHFDIIIANFGSNGNRAVELRKRGLLGGKIITIFYGYDLSRLIKENGSDFYKNLFENGDYFLAVSQFFVDKLIQLGCDKEKTGILRLGINLNELKFAERKPLGKKISILSIARLVEKKGLEYSIKAVKKISDDGFDVRYDIIGDGNLRQELVDLICKLGLQEKVFLKGWQNRQEVANFLKEADIFVAPSVVAADGDCEGIPVALEEAMAVGIPVIATFHAGIPELVKDGFSGFLVAEKKEDEIYGKLKHILSDQKLARSISVNARREIENNWDIGKINLQFEEIIKKVFWAVCEVPQSPRKLPGSFWAITTFFNPEKYKTKYKNYKKFRKASKKQGLNLLAVELAFGDADFQLKKCDAEIIVRIRGNKNNIMWQKEAMLNIGLKNLPADCDKVCWIDCDIIFKNDDWVKETCNLLEKYKVVQPFKYSVRLKNKDYKIDDPNNLDFGIKEGNKIHSVAFGIANFGRKAFSQFMHHGHTGYVWAARRDIFDKQGFYDLLLLGSADYMMAFAFYGHPWTLYDANLFTEEMKASQKKWAQSFSESVNGSVYYTNGTVLHLWHGSYGDRAYFYRHTLLKKYGFDPDKDVKRSESGLIEWASDKDELHEAIRKSFSLRNEDGIFWKNLSARFSNVLKPNMVAFKIKLTINQIIGKCGEILKKISPKLYLLAKRYFPDNNI